MIYIITGPTASGKTEYTLNLAANLKNPLIINADASQVYTNFQVLTATPTQTQMQSYEHTQFSFLEITKKYSVAKWLEDVKKILETQSQNRDIIIVGGSMMYIFCLLNGLSKIPEITEEIKEKYENDDTKTMQDFVLKHDPNAKLDTHRLQKNYLLLMQTGSPISFWQTQKEENFFNNYKTHCQIIKIELNRSQLYLNCNSRFKKMLQNGAIEEVKNCINSYGENFLPQNILGYQEVRDLVLEKISLEKCIEIGSQKTRNYAKRQLTWLKNKIF